MIIKKFILAVISLLIVLLCTSWLFAVLGNVTIYHDLTLLPSYAVLLERDKSGLILTVITSACFILFVLMNFLIPNASSQYKWRFRTKDERTRHSKLYTEKQIINELELSCIKYNSNGSLASSNPNGGVLVASHTDKLYVWPDYIHSLYVGTTKSGKTESLLMPQLQAILDSNENAMVIDPKATLYTEYGWRFKQAGYQVYRINLVSPLLGNCRNPFEQGTIAYKQAIEDYRLNIAEWQQKKIQAMIDHILFVDFLKSNPQPVFNNSKAIESWTDVADLLTFEKGASKNKIWNDHAKNMIIGGACLLAELNQFDYINVQSIRGLFANPQTVQLYYRLKPDKTSDSFNFLAAYVNSPDVTRDSMLSNFNDKTQILTLNKEIRMMTSFTDIDFLDLTRKKCILFFNCHDEKGTYFPLMSLYVDQIYQDLVAESRKRLTESGIERLPIPINFIFEEFGIMHPLKNIKTMLGACRSRGIRLFFFCQDFLQLKDSYGHEIAADIVAQCQHIVYLLSGDEQTKKDISSKAGSRQVWNKDRQAYETVPVLTIDQLNALKLGEFVSIFQRIKGCCKHKFAYYKNARYYKSKPDEMIESDATNQVLREVPFFDLEEYIEKELNTYEYKPKFPRTRGPKTKRQIQFM